MEALQGANTSTPCVDCQVLKKKCQDCRKASNRERQARYREKQRDSIKNTRSIVANKRSKYKHILCNSCLDKAIKDICEECGMKYQRAKTNNYAKRRKLEVENKTINGTNSQPNKTGCRKVESIYDHLLCNACKLKPIKEICNVCQSNYTTAKSIKSRENKKANSGPSGGSGGSDGSGVDSNKETNNSTSFQSKKMLISFLMMALITVKAVVLIVVL